MMNIIDSHCHLDRLNFERETENLELSLAIARNRGVKGFLCVGTDLENFSQVKSIAELSEDIWCSAGIHPLTEMDAEDLQEDELQNMALSSPKVVAIGECGLDYYYKKDQHQNQKALFEKQLKVALAVKKPVIVHTREAREDTISILTQYCDKGLTGVLHCFTESLDMAQAALEMGFYISFSGVISFRNADVLRQVVQTTPLDRMLVETDSPYLAPVPHRGKSNQPQWVVEVAEWVAKVKGCTIEEVAQVTTENFFNLFNIPEKPPAFVSE